MAHKATQGRIDDRLARLLAVEERLEARLSEAEHAAAQLVLAMREELERTREKDRAEFEAMVQAEERADEEAHRRELDALAVANAAELEALGGVPDDVVERLARRAVSAAIGGSP